MNIPRETIAFLRDRGVPKEAPLLVELLPDVRFLEKITHGEKRYFVVGNDQGTDLGVEEGSGELWSIDPSGELPARFVSSSLPAFVALLASYVRRQPALQAADDDEAGAIVEDLRDQLASIDPRAVEDPENWWSVILEQTGDGLL